MWVTMESDLFTGSEAPYTPSEVNLSALLEVWKFVGPGYEKLCRVSGPYSTTTKQIDFDISRIFDRNISLPSAASIGVSPGTPYSGEAVGLVEVYQLLYSDQYGDPVAGDDFTTSDDLLAINGGLPADALQDINWAGTLIPLHSYYYKRNDAFIFYKPVSPQQPDWIYFVSLVTDNIIVKVTIQYDDGTTDLFTSHTIAVEANKAYWTQSGHDQLKITDNADADKTVAGYQVSLIRESTEQNAYTQFYLVDDVCTLQDLYLLYHNGFGGYESVRMKGATKYTHRVSREKFVRTKWKDFSTDIGNIEQIRVQGNRVYNTHIGHYPAHYIEHLRQMLHGNLWMIDLDLTVLASYRFLRIMCETDSVDLRTDEPGPDGFSISYSPAWEDDGYNVF